MGTRTNQMNNSIVSNIEAMSEIGKQLQLHVDTAKADTDSIAESMKVVKRDLEQSNKEKNDEHKLIRKDFQKISEIESQMLQDTNKKIKNIKAGTDEDIKVRVDKLEMNFKNSNLDETVNDKVEKDIEEIKEELDKHNEEAKARSAASGVGEPRTRLDGQNEKGREMREAIEQIKEDARNAEERLGLKVEEANGKIIDLKNDAQRSASQYGNKLLNLKETSVQKLAENASQADVVSGVEDLIMHLEGAMGWTNATELFKALKTAKERLEGGKLEELIDEVSENTKNEFNKDQFDHQARSK